MWISKLELNNFKSYYFQSFNFPQPEREGNLTLIGGMNGFGKTTLLEALYLCLYGADAMPHLGRAGLKPTEERKGYPTFLERALNVSRGVSLSNISPFIMKLFASSKRKFNLDFVLLREIHLCRNER